MNNDIASWFRAPIYTNAHEYEVVSPNNCSYLIILWSEFQVILTFNMKESKDKSTNDISWQDAQSIFPTSNYFFL